MKAKHLTAANSGFTIIEVLFVLAIAGFILLLVFQAIPTLQRGARNNERKQDATAVLRAVSQYELSNAGDFPIACGNLYPACTVAGSFLQYDKAKFSIYDPTDTTKFMLIDQCIVVSGSCTNRNNRPPVTNSQKIIIYNYEKCDTQTQGAAIIDGAGYNDVVALYALESGSSTPTPQCIQL